jgi:tetratricopeptide (TPR) repeat protein
MGFASGFRAGWDAVGEGISDREKRQLKEKLAQESERYGVTEGAYGPELSQNIEQLRGLQAQDPGQAAIYEQSIGELTRRRGLTAPDYTIASRSMRPEDTFATREAAEMAAKPMRTQGLARVYREAGEVDKAEELLERADRQKLTGLQTRAAEMTVKERERAIEAQQKLDSFEAWRAENPNVMGSQLKDVARSQFKLNDDQLLKVTSTITGLAENDLKQFQVEMKNAIKGKDLKGLVELYNTDDRLDPNTDVKVVRGKNGAVTLNFVDKQGNPVSSQNFSSEALATAFLNKQATEPDQVAEWLLGIQRTQAAIAASERSGRPGPGTPSLSQKIADAERALGRTLTAEEKSIMAGLSNRPGLGGDRPVEVQEPGIRVMVGGQLRVTDGEGGYVAPGGVVPADRTAFLQDAGVRDNLISQLDWSPDGLTVGFGGKQYNPRDPRDIRELNDDYRRLGANTIAVEEAQRNTPGRRGLGTQPEQVDLPLYFAP